MNSISAIAGLGIPLIPNVYGGEAPTEGFVLSAKDSDDVVRGTTQNDSSLVRRIVTTTAVCSLTVGAGEERSTQINCSIGIPIFLSLMFLLLNIFVTASASIIAMISIPAIMVFLAGVTCCLNSISVVYSHFHISRSPGEFQLSLCIAKFGLFNVSQISNSQRYYHWKDLRSSVNTIRQQAMVLTETVDFLKSSADNLQNEIDE